MRLLKFGSVPLRLFVCQAITHAELGFTPVSSFFRAWKCLMPGGNVPDNELFATRLHSTLRTAHSAAARAHEPMHTTAERHTSTGVGLTSPT